MGQEKNKPPGRLSLPPPPDAVDDGWNDDIFAGTFDIPTAEDNLHDRITANLPEPPKMELDDAPTVIPPPDNELPAEALPEPPKGPMVPRRSPSRAQPPSVASPYAPTYPGAPPYAQPAAHPPAPGYEPFSLDSIPPTRPRPEMPTLPGDPDLGSFDEEGHVAAAATNSGEFDFHAKRPLELDDLDLGLDDDLDADTPARPQPPLDHPSPAATEAATIRRSAGDPVIDPLMTSLLDRYEMGDFSGALQAAETLLEHAPNHQEAAKYAAVCRETLTEMYSARLGSFEQVVRVAVPPDQIRWLSMDHRTGFLLSLVDGMSSVENLLDISGMPPLETLKTLYELLEQGVIALES